MGKFFKTTTVMDSKIVEQLRKCSKDDASFSKLEVLFNKLQEELKTKSNQLTLLERAIKYDYDSIVITDLNLENPGPQIVYVNDGFSNMTGYSREEAIGKTPRMLQGEKTDRRILERLKNRLIEGQAFFGHTVNYRKDGSEFINQWDIHPLTNEKGEITHWVSYQRDISDRQDSTKALFDANIDFEKLEEESKRTFIDLDVQGNIISSKKSFREILDRTEEELKQFKIWELVQDSDKDEMEFLFGDFMPEAIGKKQYPWTFVSKSGNKVELEGDISWFTSNDQRVIRIHFDNISLRNKVIETLKLKTSSLDKMLGKRDEFNLRFIKTKDGNLFCRYVSEAYSNLTGFSPDNILDNGIETVLDQGSIQTLNNAVKEAFKGSLNTQIIRYKTSDDNMISFVQSFKPIWNEDKTEITGVKSDAMIEVEIEN